MKIFISYKLRNSRNKKDLKDKLTAISEVFEKRGYKTYLHWRDDQNWTNRLSSQDSKEIISRAFASIKESDIILAFIESNKTSEGMLLELGYGSALGKKIIIASSKILSKGYLETIAHKLIYFTNFDTLIDSLNEVDIENI